MNRILSAAAAALFGAGCLIALAVIAVAWAVYRAWCFIRAGLETLLLGKSAEEQLACYEDDIQKEEDALS